MAELKTKPTDQSVEQFLNGIADEKRRQDGFLMLKLMKQATKEEPRMWGSSIIGFGDYRYKYESGREIDWFLIGFSPRKQNLALYIQTGFDGYDGLMEKLGKFTTGKSCLYIKKIEDVDLSILEQLIRQSIEHLKSAK